MTGRGAAWMLLVLIGCKHSGMGGFHSFSAPHVSAPTVHVASPAVPHVPAPATGGTAAAPHFGAGRAVAEAADVASDAVNIAANVAVAAANADVQAAAPEEEVGPGGDELRWAEVANLVATADHCAVATRVALGATPLRRNTSLTLYITSREGWGDALASHVDLTVTVTGPVRLTSPSLEGNAVTLLPDGRLGGPVHVEVIRRSAGTRLELDLATEDADEPCVRPSASARAE